MKTFGIANWEQKQHYRDRMPPWIKLYNSLLDDYEFSCLQDASKLHLVLIWLLASRNNNSLPYDCKWIKSRIGVDSDVDLNELLDKGFIYIDTSNDNGLQLMEQDASKALSKCEQDACLEERRGETERETEQSLKPIKKSVDKKRKRFDSSPANFEQWNWPSEPDHELFDDWIAMRRKVKATISERSFKAIGKELTKAVGLGFSVDQCLAEAEIRSWKGFKAEWMANSVSSGQAGHGLTDEFLSSLSRGFNLFFEENGINSRWEGMPPGITANIKSIIDGYPDREFDKLDTWNRLLDHISKSDWLMGRTANPFTLSISWLTKPDNFFKIINGEYHSNKS
jgi:hypothetical protein